MRTTVVRHVDGTRVRIEHAEGATIDQLKELIAQRTGIDVAHQRLKRGGEPAEGADLVTGHGASEGRSGQSLLRSDAAAAELDKKFATRGRARPAVLASTTVGRVAPCRMSSDRGCYVNAALQCLLSSPELASAFCALRAEYSGNTGTDADQRRRNVAHQRRIRLVRCVQYSGDFICLGLFT